MGKLEEMYKPVVVIKLQHSKYQGFNHDNTGENQKSLRLSTDIGWQTSNDSIGRNQLKMVRILGLFSNYSIISPLLLSPEAKTEQKRTS